MLSLDFLYYKLLLSFLVSPFLNDLFFASRTELEDFSCEDRYCTVVLDPPAETAASPRLFGWSARVEPLVSCMTEDIVLKTSAYCSSLR